MDNMQVKDFGDFKSPSRKPWLLLIIVLVILGVVVLRRYKGEPNADVDNNAKVTNQVKSDDLSKVAEKSMDLPLAKSSVNASDVPKMLAKAKAKENTKSLLEARRAYLSLWKMNLDNKTRADVEQHLGKIDIDLLFTEQPMPEKIVYVVQPGNSVQRIANRFGTTVDLIKRSNHIKNANLIKAGDRLSVFQGKFTITVSKKRNDIIVFMNDEFFKRYRVGTGKFGKTPVGTFIIADKIKEPVWWRPDGKAVPFSGDPKGENILGTRWMSLRATGETEDVRGYGIHGTWNNASIGYQQSAGCIRMRNEEVEELFVYMPLKAPVTITE